MNSGRRKFVGGEEGFSLGLLGLLVMVKELERRGARRCAGRLLGKVRRIVRGRI